MHWIKALHIIFVVCWFAALFYLPRIFVNLAMLPPDSTAERERLLLMAKKLYRFGHPLMGLTIIFGGILWLYYGISGGWLHAKLTLVIGLVVYYHYCGKLLRDFSAGRNARTHAWYRVFNEVPALALFVIVILAVVKPF